MLGLTVDLIPSFLPPFFPISCSSFFSLPLSPSFVSLPLSRFFSLTFFSETRFRFADKNWESLEYVV